MEESHFGTVLQVTREAFLKNLVSTIYYTLNGSYNVLAANIDHDYAWTNQQGTILYAFGKYQDIPVGVWCAAVPSNNELLWTAVKWPLILFTSVLPSSKLKPTREAERVAFATCAGHLQAAISSTREATIPATGNSSRLSTLTF